MYVKTRFLIISDTHGRQIPYNYLEPVDVAIHCGDLTEESKISEFEAAIQFLKEINAPLKLAIAGNHDWTLDTPSFEKKAAEVRSVITAAEIKQHYGELGAARRLFDDEGAKAKGIVFLDEGTYQFTLTNGALLTIYASPYSRSLDNWGGLGDWGFQYNSNHKEHEWIIGKGVDVVVTHGPPEGIMDRTVAAKRLGSQSLFAAVAKAKPKMHCFGHVHNNWELSS